MPLKLPQIAGHRGAAAYAPENTIAGIHTAADMGIEWVELDVKLTKDKVPVLFHDDTLDRTTNGSGPVAEADLAYIRELEAGSWFSEGFSGIHIPTLEEAIEVLVERGLGLNLEIKPCPGREAETAEAALDILSRYWDDHDRLLVSSFRHGSLETALDVAADWNRALLFDDIPENWHELAEYLKVSTICFNADKIEKDPLRMIMEAGFRSCAYTVNDPEAARILSAWGVDCLISDEPDIVKDSIFTVH